MIARGQATGIAQRGVVQILTESMEDYMETIYRLSEEKGYVRAVDISESLNVQASSVTRMIQKLDEAGFVKYEIPEHLAHPTRRSLRPLSRVARRYPKALLADAECRYGS